ncbi:MAG: 2-keto-4-pentenoate hydratase [Burkholderiales bacterium]
MDQKARAAKDAAAIVWKHWQSSTRIDALPETCRPADRAAGYAVQREIARMSGQRVVGWKIAATSAAGQTHIGVDGPLAGPLLANKVLASGASIPLAGNIMNVAEAEFAFEMAIGLPPRKTAYVQEEVLAAVASLAPAIEIPDTRFNDFARAGAPQLIADCACACWLVVGAITGANWRSWDLVRHQARAYRNESIACTGEGANVLGDPRIALTWIANELATYGDGLKAGDIVTTGTCIVPVAVVQGDAFRVDFGVMGSVSARLA